MEFFNSILRHDVLNAVTVIGSRGEFLAAELEGEQARYAETIVSWSRDVEDIVQRVRSVLDTLTGSGDPQLEPVDLAAALYTELDRVRTTYSGVTVETEVPETVTILGNDLVDDVLGNVVTNAVDHNDAEDLHLSITVEERDDEVVVRVADDGGGVPDEHKETIFRRDETGHAKSTGSGFGLFFVDAMMAEYGGDVRVDDNDDGGATFVLTFRTADQETA
jgi:signal transduction histidine kinase